MTCGKRSQTAVGRINGEPGRLETWRELDALIQDQFWRAAHFRVAEDDINYRRFFNINDLAGLRMELPDLFDHAHRRIFELCAEGCWMASGSIISTGCSTQRPISCVCATHAPRPFYLVVEKILARARGVARGLAGRGHDRLRLHQPGAWRAGRPGRRDALYASLLWLSPASTTISTRSCATCKLRIMVNEMASELNVLGRDAGACCAAEPA